MHTPLTQPLFVQTQMNTAITAFMGDQGRDLLLPRTQGGETEQVISREFARYITRTLRNAGVPLFVAIDSEYHYAGTGQKTFSGMEPFRRIIEDAKRTLRYDGEVGIRPDIIIHQRGHAGPNYVVIELKKLSNRSRKQTAFDLMKLQLLTSREQRYRYHFGFQIRACDHADTAARRLEVLSIWRNGRLAG